MFKRKLCFEFVADPNENLDLVNLDVIPVVLRGTDLLSYLCCIVFVPTVWVFKLFWLASLKKQIYFS